MRRSEAGEAAPALEALLRETDVLVQRFLPEILSRGEVSVVCLGSEPLRAVRKTPAPEHYVAHPSHGARVDEVDVRPHAGPVRGVLEAARVDPPLYARVDLVERDAAPPLLMELELVEPYLYLDRFPDLARRYVAEALARVA